MYPATKRTFDLLLSMSILLVLAPLLLLVALLIKMDSSGPILFKQERLGRRKEPFTIYKFRTMYVNAPKNIPTALLHDSNHHITRVGALLRKTSIDELPQLINILKGDMSIVGPRPVILKEQELILERDLLGVYHVLPGVTGLAQVNGRDEVSLLEKAQFDGEYVAKQSFLFDLKILISTMAYVLKMDGVVEGVMSVPTGTGSEVLPKKKILMLGNSEIVIYNFRLELVQRLLANGHEVIISSPPGEEIDRLVAMGCIHEPVEINRRGLSPFSDLKLLHHYRKLMRRVEPDMVFSYTVKPNIYGSLAAKRDNIPFVTNVTGLGSSFEKTAPLRKIMVLLYKLSLTNVQTIFFQNEKNRQFFEDNQIAIGKHEIIAGSGVNLNYYTLMDYPPIDDSIDFVLISRIMKEKGIDEYLAAAKQMKAKYAKVRFHIAGYFEENYEEVIEEYVEKGIIIYHGLVNDVREILSETHCTVLPSYHEGMSNVLLESAASGRPVIASNINGCIETFDEGVSGYGFELKDVELLVQSMEQFMNLSYDEMRNMGLAGRKKMESSFDREQVVDIYMDEIDKFTEKVLEVQHEEVI